MSFGLFLKYMPMLAARLGGAFANALMALSLVPILGHELASLVILSLTGIWFIDSLLQVFLINRGALELEEKSEGNSGLRKSSLIFTVLMVALVGSCASAIFIWVKGLPDVDRFLLCFTLIVTSVFLSILRLAELQFRSMGKSERGYFLSMIAPPILFTTSVFVFAELKAVPNVTDIVACYLFACLVCVTASMDAVYKLFANFLIDFPVRLFVDLSKSVALLIAPISAEYFPTYLLALSGASESIAVFEVVRRFSWAALMFAQAVWIKNANSAAKLIVDRLFEDLFRLFKTSRTLVIFGSVPIILVTFFACVFYLDLVGISWLNSMVLIFPVLVAQLCSVVTWPAGSAVLLMKQDINYFRVSAAAVTFSLALYFILIKMVPHAELQMAIVTWSASISIRQLGYGFLLSRQRIAVLDPRSTS
jgi:hypothetical protein